MLISNSKDDLIRQISQVAEHEGETAFNQYMAKNFEMVKSLTVDDFKKVVSEFGYNPEFGKYSLVKFFAFYSAVNSHTMKTILPEFDLRIPPYDRFKNAFGKANRLKGHSHNRNLCLYVGVSDYTLDEMSEWIPLSSQQ